LFALGTIFGPTIVSSAPIAPPTANIAAEADHSLVQEVQWGYCRRWRHICANRWGWRTNRFFWCVRQRGC
jgi:hypothetical protein